MESARRIEVASEKSDIKQELAKLKTLLDYRGFVEKDNRKYQKYIWDQIDVIKNSPPKKKRQQVQCLVDMIYVAIYEEEELRLEDRKK